MCSDRKAPSLRRRIVATSLCAGALILFLTGSLILAVSQMFMTAERRGLVTRIANDLAQEYAEASGDKKKMRHFFEEIVEEHGADKVSLLISSASGEEIVSMCHSDAILRAMLAHARRNVPEYRISKESAAPRRRRNVLRVKTTELPDGRRLSVGCDVANDESYIAFLATIIGCALLVSLLLGGCTADLLARRFMRSLRNISDAANRIRDGEWSVRVAPSRESREIALLEDAFNTMCDRNEKTIRELRTLTDDIAHDLRTPLTRLRTAAEFAAMGGQPKTPLPEMVFEQSSDMLELINTMLEISQTGCRVDNTPRENIDFCTFLRETADLYSTVVEDHGLFLALALPPEPVVFSGHKGRLQRLIGNLLDNAIKFTPKGGVISVSLADGADALTLRVADTGCGISSQDIPNVFRRFWRSDASRSLPGNGLGLALVKAIVTSYAGFVTCESEQGRGTVFTITLPH